jgi:hypothetical protein
VSVKTTSEWTLWIVAGSCALHATEEYFTGWQQWATQTLGIVMPTTRFFLINAVLVVAAFLLAGIGWRRPTLSLVIPAATFVNAVCFHILPTLVQHRAAPGVYSAAALYVPFSSWAYVGAWRDGVPRRSIVAAFTSGTLLMIAVVLIAKLSGS